MHRIITAYKRNIKPIMIPQMDQFFDFVDDKIDTVAQVTEQRMGRFFEFENNDASTPDTIARGWWDNLGNTDVKAFNIDIDKDPQLKDLRPVITIRARIALDNLMTKYVNPRIPEDEIAGCTISFTAAKQRLLTQTSSDIPVVILNYYMAFPNTVLAQTTEDQKPAAADIISIMAAKAMRQRYSLIKQIHANASAVPKLKLLFVNSNATTEPFRLACVNAWAEFIRTDVHRSELGASILNDDAKYDHHRIAIIGALIDYISTSNSLKDRQAACNTLVRHRVLDRRPSIVRPRSWGRVLMMVHGASCIGNIALSYAFVSLAMTALDRVPTQADGFDWGEIKSKDDPFEFDDMLPGRLALIVKSLCYLVYLVAGRSSRRNDVPSSPGDTLEAVSEIVALWSDGYSSYYGGLDGARTFNVILKMNLLSFAVNVVARTSNQTEELVSGIAFVGILLQIGFSSAVFLAPFLRTAQALISSSSQPPSIVARPTTKSTGVRTLRALVASQEPWLKPVIHAALLVGAWPVHGWTTLGKDILEANTALVNKVIADVNQEIAKINEGQAQSDRAEEHQTKTDVAAGGLVLLATACIVFSNLIPAVALGSLAAGTVLFGNKFQDAADEVGDTYANGRKGLGTVVNSLFKLGDAIGELVKKKH